MKDSLPIGRDDMTAVPQSPQLDRHAQARIGEQLRTMYDDLLKQPVPDRFLELLRQMDNQEGRVDKKGGEGGGG